MGFRDATYPSQHTLLSLVEAMQEQTISTDEYLCTLYIGMYLYGKDFQQINGFLN